MGYHHVYLLFSCNVRVSTDIRGISKSIRHFIRHFIRHSTILCATWPSHAPLDHLIRHSTILSVTQQFCQDVDFINKFDTIWSSKWLWSIIFFSESGYLDDRTFQHMHVTVKALKDLHVFAHWRYMDLLVWLLCICQTQQSAFADKWYQRFVWNIAGFLPKQFVYFPTPIICICRRDISTFVRDGTMVVFFTAHQLEFIRPTHFHPALPTEWWMVMDRNIWW